MNHSNHAQQEPIPTERLAEAGVWIARLHGDDRDRRTEAGFRQWLSAHPLNARAFELTTEVWEDSHNLRRVVPFAHEVPRKDPRRLYVPILLAAAIAAVAVVVRLWPSDVATNVGEQRLLALEDGSRVYLNTATRIAVRYDGNFRRIDLKGGEALFDVAKDPVRPFVVQAGERRVTALGTSFVVRYDKERTAVTLVEGKVAVETEEKEPDRAGENPDNAAVTLQPGQRLTFVVRKPAKLDTPTLDSAIAWRRGQVVLKDMPLSGAISEMNRYSEQELIVEDEQAAGLLINGLFQAGDSKSFARVVALTYGLTVAQYPDHIVLRGQPKPTPDAIH